MVACRPMLPPRVRAVLRPGQLAATAAATTALLLAAAFAGEAFATGAAALVVGGSCAVLALVGRLPFGAGGLPLVAGLAALAAWSGISVVWSVGPDLSWHELNRGLVYVAFAVLGVVLGSFRDRGRVVAALALTAALAAAVTWALAGKAIPALFPDGGRAARLRDPIGYWNALALAADMALVLGLWLAAGAARAPRRAVGVVLAYAGVVAVLLATSRAGTVAAVVAVCLWLAIAGARVERALLALAAAVPGIAVATWAFTQPALVEDAQALPDRVAAGRWFALALVVGAAAAALAADGVSRLDLRGDRRRLVGRALAAGFVGVVVAAAVGVAAAGDPLGDGRAVPQGPGRLADAGLNNRRQFWAEAIRLAQAEPLTGTGAGTFELARRRVRDDATSAVEPHSVPLQFLAGTGPAGLLLFAGVVAAAATAAARALRRTEGEDRRAAAALTAVLAAYGVHALVDYDWNFVAVTAPALVAAGALAAAGRDRLVAPSPLAAAGAAALTIAALASAASPWLAEREVDRAATALAAAAPDRAIEHAERAQALNPLSIAPHQTLAAVHASRRRVRQAREAYAAAIRLQPENPETWYELGLYEYDRRLYCQAYRHLNEAYTLDPKSTRWVADGPLDVARDVVNTGRCG